MTGKAVRFGRFWLLGRAFAATRMRRSRARAAMAGAVAVAGAAALVAAGAAVGGAVPDARAALRAASPWGKAIAVPGLRALNKNGAASVVSLSCALPGSCAAGGHYTGSIRRGLSRLEGFVT